MAAHQNGNYVPTPMDQPPGSIWGSVSSPRTLWHADLGSWGSTQTQGNCLLVYYYLVSDMFLLQQTEALSSPPCLIVLQKEPGPLPGVQPPRRHRLRRGGRGGGGGGRPTWVPLWYRLLQVGHRSTSIITSRVTERHDGKSEEANINGDEMAKRFWNIFW